MAQVRFLAQELLHSSGMPKQSAVESEDATWNSCLFTHKQFISSCLVTSVSPCGGGGGGKLKTYVRYLEKENFFFPLESKALVICSLLSVQVGFSSYRHFFSQADLPGCWLSSFLPLLYSSCNQNAISCHPSGINYNPISFRKTFWLMQVYSQFST